ncbi:MAG: peptidylprolyl isomerase [Thalassovita sp.]
MKTTRMRRIILALASVGMLATNTATAQAQSLFSPAIRVNDRAITYYELEQRQLMLEALNPAGDAVTLAREQLIEERLKLDAAAELGIRAEDEEMAEGLKEFAGRANLTPDKFKAFLQSRGIAQQTFDDFLYSGLVWRNVVGARFAARSVVTEADIDKALQALATNSSAQVLLSEIVIPMPQGKEQQAMALAEELSQASSIKQFSDFARRYSASNSRDDGGRLKWTPVTKLPPPLQPVIMALNPGDVTDPIPLKGAVALFQLRDIAESAYRAPRTAALEYATYLIPGGRSAEALATAQAIMDDTDTCDDLYGHAKGQPDEILTVNTQKPGEVPRDIGIELSKLDKGEFSTNLTRNNGQTLMLVMLCARTPVLSQDASREELTAQLRNQRIQALAQGYLQELLADARIIEE